MLHPFSFSQGRNNIELATGYYLDNFLKLTHHAVAEYSDLLTASEHQWLFRFNQLSLPSKFLIVRLLTRKGEWFRSDKLHYEEIPDILNATKELAHCQFISLNPSLSESEFATHLLTKVEICKRHPTLSKSLKKDELIQSLDSNAPIDVGSLSFQIIQLKHPAILNLLSVLFFANAYQDISQFVVESLGLQKFESYTLSDAHRFFKNREQVNALIALSAIAERYTLVPKSLPKNEKHAFLILMISEIESIFTGSPLIETHSYIQNKRHSLTNLIARDFERLDDYQLALSLFETNDVPPSRERRARIRLAQNQTAKAQLLVNSMFEHPHSADEPEIAQRIQDKINRLNKLKVTRHKKPAVEDEHLILDLTTQRVEVAVLSHYEQLGWKTYFTENAFLGGLFGLIYWEVIFAPVEGAFLNQFQVGPKDLNSRSFVAKRDTEIQEAKTAFIDHGYPLLMTRWNEKKGTLNPFVFWDTFPIELIERTRQCLSPSQLLALCDVIFMDIKAYRAGMPDLVAFKNDQIQWIEVKGPGDKLQDNQWRWIKQCQKLGFPIRTCYVKALT